MLNSTQYAELILEGAKNMDDFYGDAYDDPASYTTAARETMDYFSYGEWAKDPSKTYDWQDRVFQKDITAKLIYKLEVVTIKQSSLAQCSI